MREKPIKFLFPAVLVLSIAFFILFLSACAQKSDSQSRAPQSGTVKSVGSAQRIVCAAPSVTEFVFALGLGERVVGVSDFSTYPSEALTKPKIGGLINPNREKITTLQPDLLILQGQNESLARFCQNHRIRFLPIEINSLDDIWTAIYTIGRTLNVEGPAHRLVQKIKEDIQAIKNKTQNLPPKRVFLTLGHTPGDLTGLMTSGPGTFLHELVSIAGGENIFSDVRGLYPQVSKESLVKRQPEVIIEAIPGGVPEDKLFLLEKDWKQLPMLPAVRSGNIHYLKDDFLLIPGVRVAQTVRLFAEILHPEAFDGEPDA